MQGPQHEYRGAPLWPLGALVVVFAAANLLIVLLIVPVMRDVGPGSVGVFLVGVLYGLIAGQAGLVTLWAVFGCHPWVLRWLTTLAAAEFLAGAFFLGAVLSNEMPPSWKDVLVVPLFLPLLFLAMQAPLWLFRAITGWQIVPRGWEETSWEARQFGIVDLLGVTAFTAVALGLTQMAFSLGNVRRAEMPSAWLPLVFGYAVASGLNGLLSLPCLWAVFAARDRAQAVVVLVVYYALLGIALLALLALMSPGSGSLPAEVVGVVIVFEVVDVGVLAGGLCLIRAGPYVLLRPRRKRAAAQFGPDADSGTCPFAPVEREEPPPGESLKAES